MPLVGGVVERTSLPLPNSTQAIPSSRLFCHGHRPISCVAQGSDARQPQWIRSGADELQVRRLCSGRLPRRDNSKFLARPSTSVSRVTLVSDGRSKTRPCSRTVAASERASTCRKSCTGCLYLAHMPSGPIKLRWDILSGRIPLSSSGSIFFSRLRSNTLQRIALAGLVLGHVSESRPAAKRARPDAKAIMAVERSKACSASPQDNLPELLVAIAVVMASGARLSSDSMYDIISR